MPSHLPLTIRARLHATIARVIHFGTSCRRAVQRAFFEYEDVWIVHCAHEGFACDPVCARCLSPATRSRVEASPSGTKTIPYCEACADIFGKRNVALLGWVLACTLAGVAGCVFFPLLPNLSLQGAVVGALVFAGAPWVIGQLWLARADLALRQRSAARFGANGLICSNAEWASRLAQRLGCEVTHQRVRGRATSGWFVSGLVIAAVLTPGLHDAFHCELRIVNLTDEDLVISVDGRQLAITKPSTEEHPLAGSQVRVAMGSRRFEARNREGALIHADSVRIGAAQTYLYAPAHPANTCFWIERTTIGRLHRSEPLREYLPGDNDFWQLPVPIDTWFTPALRSESDFFSGGVVTSLRQGPCQSAAIFRLPAIAPHF